MQILFELHTLLDPFSELITSLPGDLRGGLYDVSAPERRCKLRFIVITYDTYEEGIITLIPAFMKYYTKIAQFILLLPLDPPLPAPQPPYHYFKLLKTPIGR